MSRRGALSRLDDLIAANAPPSAVQSAEALSPESEAAAKRKRELTETVDRLLTKVQALAWVVLAGCVWHFAGVRGAALDAERSNIIFLGLGLAACAIVFSIFFYLAVYLPHIARLRVDWSVYAPNAIPTATAAGLVAFFSFIIGLWPAYRLTTPLVVAALFMGAVMSTHFMPF